MPTRAHIHGWSGRHRLGTVPVHAGLDRSSDLLVPRRRLRTARADMLARPVGLLRRDGDLWTGAVAEGIGLTGYTSAASRRTGSNRAGHVGLG